MVLKIILLEISFALGYVCIHFIRRYDIHEKEPISKMALVVFFGGMTSIIITHVLYQIIGKLGFSNFESSVGALFFVGPIEEFSKIAALFILYFIFKNNMNEPIDGIIYMSCVALGFSLIENLFYAFPNKDTSFLIIERILICTPVHIIFSSYMGIAFYYYKKGMSKFNFLIITFIFASFLHGMYDLMVYNQWVYTIFITFIFFSYQGVMFLVGYAIAKSPFRKSLKKFIEDYKNPSIEKGLECLLCGSKNRKLTYVNGKIKIQKCDKCPFYISDYNSLFYIFRYFGSKFSMLNLKYISPESMDSEFGTLYESNFISKEKKLCFFDLEKLNETLERLSKTIIEEIESNRWLKDNFLISYSSNDKSNYDDKELSKHKEYFDNGKIKIEGFYKDNLMQGIWKYYYENGKIKATGTFLNGKGADISGLSEIPKDGREGLWTFYYGNGNKKAIYNYKNGKKDGSQMMWYDNNKMKYKVNYVNGKIDGIQQAWYKNGQKYREQNFRNGLPHGEKIEWNEDGTKKIQEKYKDGTLINNGL